VRTNGSRQLLSSTWDGRLEKSLNEVADRGAEQINGEIGITYVEFVTGRCRWP
jgi:hypothetical protein